METKPKSINDEFGEKDFDEFVKQEFSETINTISETMKAAEKISAEEKAKRINELYPEILILAGELKHSPRFIDVPFEKFIKAKEFKDLIADAIERKFPAESMNILEKEILKSIIPKTFYIVNNKLANEMTKDFVDQGQIDLLVMDSPKLGEILTYVFLNYEGSDISITGKYHFGAYDRALHNAVCSLWAAGNNIVTPAMVYRTVNGMTEQEKVSKQALETVFQSLYNSRFLKLIADYTEEAKARGIKGVDKFKIDSYLLPAEVITVESGGHEVQAFKILKTPPLYEYAQITGQIIGVPMSLLDTREATRNTEDIIPIREYVLRRIETMQKNGKMRNRIRYDTIFDNVGIAITSRVQKERLREYISSILELWKTRDNYIKDFREYKEGNAFVGVEITYMD